MPTLRLDNPHSKGVCFILLSAFGFACMNFFVRFAGKIPFFEKVLFCNLASCVIGVIGGIASGAAYTCVRAFGKRGVVGAEVVLVFSSFSSLLILPFFIAYAVPITLWQLICLVMVGLCATVGQFTLTAAYSYAPGRDISIYEYSNVAFSALLGFLFLGQVPDLWSLVGYVVIFSMALLMFLFGGHQGVRA